jgi:hypothetical protein
MTANRKKKLSARDPCCRPGLSYTAALCSLDSRHLPGQAMTAPLRRFRRA